MVLVKPHLPNLWRDPVLWFLLTCGSLTVMAGAVLAPVLPELILSLNLNRGWAGSLVSAHYLTMALFSPVLGIVADRWGQVRLLMPCLIAYAVLGVGGAFLPNYPTLLFDRALLGVASAGVAAASLGLLTRRYAGDVRQQAIAYAATILTLANIVYPLLSVGLGQFHWRFAFGLYGLSGVLTLGVFLGLGSRFGHAVTSGQSTGNVDGNVNNIAVGTLLKSSVCLRIFISLSVVTAVVYGTIIYLPLYLKTVVGSKLIWNGVILAIQGVGAALSSGLLLKPLAKKWGHLRLVALSLGLMGVFLVLFPHLTQLWALILVSGLFGVSFGLVTPSFYSILSDLAPAQLQSSILAAGIGSGFLGQFMSPLILGPILATQSFVGVFYSCAVLSLLIGMGLLIPLKPAQETSG